MPWGSELPPCGGAEVEIREPEDWFGEGWEESGVGRGLQGGRCDSLRRDSRWRLLWRDEIPEVE